MFENEVFAQLLREVLLEQIQKGVRGEELRQLAADTATAWKGAMEVRPNRSNSAVQRAVDTFLRNETNVTRFTATEVNLARECLVNLVAVLVDNGLIPVTSSSR